MTLIMYATLPQPLASDIFNSNLSKLSAIEQQKILRYMRWQDAHASLMGKILLLEAFNRSGYPDVSLKNMYRDSYGKPFLAEAPAFNISHSGEYVVCAVSATDIPGIDIEEVKPISFEDFTSHFTAGEWHSINNADNSLEAFYQHWCAKEAFIKKDGKGLSNELSKIEVTGNTVKTATVTNHIKYFDNFPGYEMALATEKETEVQLVPFRF